MLARPILSRSDRAILKALKPFSEGASVAFAAPNVVLGSNARTWSWLFHSESETSPGECGCTSWAAAAAGRLESWGPSASGAKAVRRFSRMVAPDLDVDVLGRWYIPRTAGVEPNIPESVMFGLSGVYPMIGLEPGAAYAFPVVEANTTMELLTVPGEQFWAVQAWMMQHSVSNTQIWWLRHPDLVMPVLHLRGAVQHGNLLTTVYFFVGGLIDRDTSELGQIVGLL